jgi:peptidoglycan/LPS O-acetylase OafA/YrhL
MPPGDGQRRGAAVTLSDSDETAPRPTVQRADVQGMRALAVLMVVAFHAGLDIPGGFTGVDVFFAISGFVITAMLLREADGTGRFGLRTFYARRVRRIMPASAVTIGVVALLSLGAINSAAQHLTARTGIAGSLFGANFVLARAPGGYFDVAATTNPLLHIWTLSVEEQFYLVFPAILLAGMMAVGKRQMKEVAGRLAVLIAVVGLASFAIGWYTSTHRVSIPGFASSAQFAFYMAPARAWEFAAGALVAIGVPLWRRCPQALTYPLGVTGIALIAIGAFAIDATTPFPGTAALLPVGGAVLLLVAGTASRRGVPALLGWHPIARVGDYSYSWYLWHWPVIVFAVALFPGASNAALIAAIVSVVPAWLSFQFLESRFRHDPRIRGRRAVGVALICIVVPVALCLALLYAPKPSASTATRALLATERAHATESRRCNLGVPVDQLPARCTWSVADPKGRVVLIGDSNAGHFVEPAARAANALGYDLTVATFPDCPFVDLRVSSAARAQQAASCRRFSAESLHQLEQDPPALVIVAGSIPLYLTSNVTFTDPNSGRVASTAAAKARLYEEGLQRTLERLRAAGTHVVVIHTVPQWTTWDPRDCANLRVYLTPQSCGASETLGEATAFLSNARVAEDRAIAAVPGAVGVDFRPEICGRDCATNRGDLWLYKDGRHLSVVGALRLEDRFRQLIDGNAAPPTRT